MDYRNNDERMFDAMYSGNRNIFCDLCYRRCRGVFHVIEQGDTLYNLGQRYRVSVSDIMRANPYVNVYNLRIGEELCIPVTAPQPRMADEYSDYMGNAAGNNMGSSRNSSMDESMIYANRGMEDASGNESLSNYEESEISLEEEQLKESSSHNMERNNTEFTEEDSLREVMDKLGITMEDLLECAGKR